MKKIILGFLLLMVVAPVYADEVNLTPKSTFSGFTNNGTRSKYPHLQQTVQVKEVVEDKNDNDFMKPVSIKQMKQSPSSNSNHNAPITYEQFPKNYDSSNNMMLMPGGLNNMMGL